jgi:hypothetical protein
MSRLITLLAPASAAFAILLTPTVDGAATTPPDPVAQQAAFLAGDGVKVLYRPQASRPRPQTAGQPVAAETAAAILGRSEAEVIARLGRPTHVQAREPGKILRYEGAGCALEIHLFPDTRDGMRALDMRATAGDCRH